MRSKAWRRMACAAGAALLTPGVAQAQEAPALPPVASIEIPPVYSQPDAKAVKNGKLDFFFFEEGVSFETAFADLQACTELSKGTGLLALPGFVPWGTHSLRPAPAPLPPQFGLVGELLGMLLLNEGDMQRAPFAMRMRRCMEPRGYVRYPMTRANWNAIHGNDQMQSILKQAKLASGPKPEFAEAIQ